MVVLKLIPVTLIGLALLANLGWQSYRVAKAEGLWKLNALAILGTSALLLMPPYDGYDSLVTAFNRGLFGLPFLVIAVIGDPGWFKLLPLAHLGIMLLFLAIFATASP